LQIIASYLSHIGRNTILYQKSVVHMGKTAMASYWLLQKYTNLEPTKCFTLHCWTIQTFISPNCIHVIMIGEVDCKIVIMMYHKMIMMHIYTCTLHLTRFLSSLSYYCDDVQWTLYDDCSIILLGQFRSPETPWSFIYSRVVGGSLWIKYCINFQRWSIDVQVQTFTQNVLVCIQ